MNKIPPALLKQITILKSPFSAHTIYLIGTAHVSKKSCQSVRELIEVVKPRILFLELCKARTAILEANLEGAQKSEGSFMEKLANYRAGESNLFSIAYSMLLRQTAKDLDTPPGAEFKAAYDAAKLCDSEIVLGDRDVFITVQRVWKGTPTFDKFKLIFQLVGSILFRPSEKELKNMVEDLKEREHVLLDMIIQMGEITPWVVESILFERDLYMMNELVRTLDSIEEDEPQDVVAVVGAGHVPGIVDRWEMEMKYPGSQLSTKNLREITRVPGDVSDDDHITKADLRTYVSSRQPSIAKRLLAMKQASAKLQVAYAARVVEIEGPHTPVL